LTKFGHARALAEDRGLGRLDRTQWHARAGIVALAIGAALVTFIAFPRHGPLSVLVGLASAFLAVVYVVARDLIGTKRDVETQAPQLKRTSFLPARRAQEATQARVAAIPQPGAQSAAGFLERFRQSLALAESEAEAAAQELRARGFARFRFAAKNVAEHPELAVAAPRGASLPALEPNDLRNYLNRRLAPPVAGKMGSLAPKPGGEVDGTSLKSHDALLDHILAAGEGAAPHALLVGGAAADADAAAEAISIARALVVPGNLVVLLDLAREPCSVSCALDLPHAPGLADLYAGSAAFEDIVMIDAETPLHVIAAGNSRPAASGHENERFMSVFEALTQTYDSVVLHADRAALRRLGPRLRFALPIVVAVLPARIGAGSPAADLGDFSALGCPVIVYEQGGEERRTRFLGWAAAI
jgi:hypothetical protein